MENFVNKMIENSTNYLQQSYLKSLMKKETIVLGGSILLFGSMWPIFKAHPIPGWRTSIKENAMEEIDQAIIVASMI